MAVGGQHHTPAALPQGKTRYPLYRRLGGPQGRSGLVRKISPLTGIRSPDRLARSKSLYRLSCLTVNSNSRTSNCQCSLFLKKNPIISIFCISESLAVPINPGKRGSTVCVYIYIYTYIYMCVYLLIYVHIYTYIYVYTKYSTLNGNSSTPEPHRPKHDGLAFSFITQQYPSITFVSSPSFYSK